jgi:multidrug efflux pump
MALTRRATLAAALAFAGLAHGARAEILPAETMIEVAFAIPGAPLEHVADRVTPLVENHLGGADGLGFMVSWSRAGSLRVVLKFKPGVGEAAALEAARRGISQALAALPGGTAPPALRSVASDVQPIALLGFVADRFSLADVTRIVEPQVRESLQAVAGVEAVSLHGARREVTRVRFDVGRLAAYGVSVGYVRTALLLHGIEALPAPSEGDAPSMTLRDAADPASVADIVVKTVNGVPVRLRDIAQIERAAASDGVVARYDGAVAVVLEVTKRPEFGRAEAARALAAQLPGTLTRLPAGLSHKAGYSCARCAAAVRRP